MWHVLFYSFYIGPTNVGQHFDQLLWSIFQFILHTLLYIFIKISVHVVEDCWHMHLLLHMWMLSSYVFPLGGFKLGSPGPQPSTLPIEPLLLVKFFFVWNFYSFLFRQWTSASTSRVVPTSWTSATWPRSERTVEQFGPSADFPRQPTPCLN